MKIKVIGSGSMWGVDNSASYMIDDDILVDMPNGCCKALKRIGIPVNNIVNVLITHFHGDHFGDIPFYFLEKLYIDGNKKMNFYCDKKGNNKIVSINNLMFPSTLDKLEDKVELKYINEESFKINNYYITKYLVQHGNLNPAYGYVFEFDNKRVGFTGDSSLCSNIEKMASICDALICDCNNVIGNNTHLGINDLEILHSKFPSCKLYASHLTNESKNELLNNKNIISLNDGDIINI